jgi:hypothetical protein
MSGPWHPTGKAKVNARAPQAQAVCDRCYLNYSLRDLKWQFQWSGVQQQNLRLLVCQTCLDVPQPQLKTIVIPADPPALMNTRPENYDETVPNYVATESDTLQGTILTTEDGIDLIWEIEDTPLPDPNNPVLYP